MRIALIALLIMIALQARALTFEELMDRCGRETRLIVIKQVCYVVEPGTFTIYDSTLLLILTCEVIYDIPVDDPKDYAQAHYVFYVTKPYVWIITKRDFKEALKEPMFTKCMAKILKDSFLIEEAILIQPGRKRNESKT